MYNASNDDMARYVINSPPIVNLSRFSGNIIKTAKPINANQDDLKKDKNSVDDCRIQTPSKKYNMLEREMIPQYKEMKPRVTEAITSLETKVPLSLYLMKDIKYTMEHIINE